MSNDWISVDERLPECETPVLVRQIYNDDTMIAEISDDGFWREQCDNLTINGNAWVDRVITKAVGGESYLRITHWMPLPEAPEDK